MASVEIRSAESGAARAREEASGSERVLVVEGLCREFGTRRVVDNLDLSLSAGERVALRGRNELGLAEILSRRLDRCSTGMLQKLALARVLIGEPPLLLLDEPTRSLDDAATELLWAAIKRRPDAAVLIATHRPDDLARCDREIQ